MWAWGPSSAGDTFCWKETLPLLLYNRQKSSNCSPHTKEPDIIMTSAKGKLNVVSLWNFHNTIIWVYVYHWRKLKSFAHFGSFELTFLIHFFHQRNWQKDWCSCKAKRLWKCRPVEEIYRKSPLLDSCNCHRGRWEHVKGYVEITD